MREVPTALSAALSPRYRLERELGVGGMATVYLARDLKHDRDVAIKVLRADVAATVGVDRFLAEIKTTGHLKHPHILPRTPRKLFGSIPDGIAMSPSWSPDGARIAFGGSGGLYVAPADGGGVLRVVAPGPEVHSPRWSADGRRIAYVSGGSIFTFGEESLGNVSTSTVMLLTLDNGQVTQITSGDWLDTNPVWMPDNQTLLFVSSRGGGRDIYTIRVKPNGRPEQEPERLTSGLNAHTISISADGAQLAYASYAPAPTSGRSRFPTTACSSG
jgi:hypothetical protein